MLGKTLGEVTDLLQDALAIHRAVRSVVLCTKEGVVVASVSRDENKDPRILSTVSAALAWAGTTTLSHVGDTKPTYLLQTTPIERIITILQPHYNLVVVTSRADDSGFAVDSFLPSFQSLATRIEIIMGSHSTFGKETILGMLVQAIPEITQAMVLTIEGLPLGSVGFANDIEVAALASSIYANGQTFAPETETLSINSDDTDLLVHRIDETRLLAVICRGPKPDLLCQRVLDVIQTQV